MKIFQIYADRAPLYVENPQSAQPWDVQASDVQVYTVSNAQLAP
ncbi:uncharacterized protein METZ01_LOCUS482693 [marine metagenome]|uniref:Uncharacterized protein n=1 Tax=marine metagenome TaxID=408172 RepID=A0A383CCQ3_9ZZZZ